VDDDAADLAELLTDLRSAALTSTLCSLKAHRFAWRYAGRHLMLTGATERVLLVVDGVGDAERLKGSRISVPRYATRS